MSDNEIWKQVDGFPHYDVSNLGRVRSWRRPERKWRNPHDSWREEPVVLTGSKTPLGYVAHILRDADGRRARRTLHRLVAQAFLPPPQPGQTDVAHNDGNPSNNHVSNLRWATHRENQMDMRTHGRMQDGAKCVTAKLTPQQVADIKSAIANGPRGTQRNLAAQYGMSRAQICRIGKGRRWAHCPELQKIVVAS